MFYFNDKKMSETRYQYSTMLMDNVWVVFVS